MQVKTFFSLAVCFAAQCILVPASAQTLPPKYSTVVSDSEWANDFKAAAQGGAGFDLVTFGLSDVKYYANY